MLSLKTWKENATSAKIKTITQKVCAMFAMRQIREKKANVFRAVNRHVEQNTDTVTSAPYVFPLGMLSHTHKSQEKKCEGITGEQKMKTTRNGRVTMLRIVPCIYGLEGIKEFLVRASLVIRNVSYRLQIKTTNIQEISMIGSSYVLSVINNTISSTNSLILKGRNTINGVKNEMMVLEKRLATHLKKEISHRNFIKFRLP